jgi:hypothetical protein
MMDWRQRWQPADRHKEKTKKKLKVFTFSAKKEVPGMRREG